MSWNLYPFLILQPILVAFSPIFPPSSSSERLHLAVLNVQKKESCIKASSVDIPHCTVYKEQGTYFSVRLTVYCLQEIWPMKKGQQLGIYEFLLLQTRLSDSPTGWQKIEKYTLRFRPHVLFMVELKFASSVFLTPNQANTSQSDSVVIVDLGSQERLQITLNKQLSCLKQLLWRARCPWGLLWMLRRPCTHRILARLTVFVIKTGFYNMTTSLPSNLSCIWLKESPRLALFHTPPTGWS